MALQALLKVNLDTQNQTANDGNFSPDEFSSYPSRIPFFTQKLPLNGLVDQSTGKPIEMKFNKGTTTLAFKYQGGLIIAADSRATGGQYIASSKVRKIIPINKYLMGTMAGGAADCQYWERVLSQRCRLYELRNRERMSTAAASKLLANIMYNYKGMGLSMGVMICGWDKKGPSIYFVSDNGQRACGNMFSVGSGSPHAYGILDSAYSWDMTDEQAIELARRAIFHAGHRDAMSGGTVNIFTMKSDGWHKIAQEDVTELYFKYRQDKEDEEMA